MATSLRRFCVPSEVAYIPVARQDRDGAQIGAVRVDEGDEIMLITDGGTLVRTLVADVSQMGRDTQGVTMIRLSNGERLIGIERIEALEGDDEEADAEDPGSDNV